ncbi:MULTISPECIES: IclR family transcriptional regulator [unclassified Jeotgalibaca]|uniref:IclR family transcriptional regulator n=1 Tax=unclassified Jeotgalibaca TaxID=2621505 RepID=UPI003FD09666
MEKVAKRSDTLSSVRNAARILNSFTADNPTQRVSDIALDLDLGKSTVSRLLATLAEEGLVTKDPETQEYHLGSNVLTMAGVLINNMDIHKEAAPVLNQVVQQTGETAHLAIMDGLDTIYIHKEEATHPTRIKTHLGRRNPSYCTSSGKVLMAFSDPELTERIIAKGLTPYTEKTIINAEQLRTVLANIKNNGYATAREEFTKGTISIAAPIFDYTGKVVAALSVVGSAKRMKPYKRTEFAAIVKNAAADASERLGYDQRYL